MWFIVICQMQKFSAYNSKFSQIFNRGHAGIPVITVKTEYIDFDFHFYFICCRRFRIMFILTTRWWNGLKWMKFDNIFKAFLKFFVKFTKILNTRSITGTILFSIISWNSLIIKYQHWWIGGGSELDHEKNGYKKSYTRCAAAQAHARADTWLIGN